MNSKAKNNSRTKIFSLLLGVWAVYYVALLFIDFLWFSGHFSFGKLLAFIPGSLLRFCAASGIPFYPPGTSVLRTWYKVVVRIGHQKSELACFLKGLIVGAVDLLAHFVFLGSIGYIGKTFSLPLLLVIAALIVVWLILDYVAILLADRVLRI